MSADSYDKQRIIITGAGGVLGTALTSALTDCKDLFPLRRSDCDLMDKASTLALWRQIQPTIVYHLAGWVAGVQGNLDNAGKAFYDNAQINLNVIEASRETGVKKVVAAGTTAIYSDEVELPMRESDMWVGSPHGSEQAYGHAKRAMFAQLEAYQRQYDLDFCFMLCTNLYGENDRFDEASGHVVPSLISRFERAVREDASEIVIWGDGTPTRDFVYSRDAANAFVTAGLAGRGAYNLASGRSIMIRDLVDELVRVTGYRGLVKWDVSKPSGQKKRSYDVSRLNALGWQASTPLHDGLAATFGWFKAHRESARR